MKKLLLLTSVLILAACGGGGGGSGTTNGAEDFVRSGFISDTTNASNNKVTSMTSAIVVAKDGSGSAIRSATKTYNGKEYNVYTLDDVKFLIAEDPTNGYFQFGIDKNGRITKVTENLGGISDDVQRVGDTTRFNAPMFEYVKAGGDNAKWRVVDNGQITKADLDAIVAANPDLPAGGQWNRIDEVLEIKTFGRGLGLQFSDFGHFNPVYRSKNKNLGDDSDIAAARAGTRTGNDTYRDEAEMEAEFTNSQDYQLFAGGYAVKNGKLTDTLTPTSGMEFKGTAHGRIYTSIQTKGTEGENRATYLTQYEVPYTPGQEHDAGHDMAKNFETKNATLKINGNTETLYMPFSDQGFYDVTVTKNVNSSAASFAFKNGGSVEKRYQKDGSVTSSESVAKMGYYGIDTPSEAAGVVQYRAEKRLDGGTSTDNYAAREWEFQAAYGMKKQ